MWGHPADERLIDLAEGAGDERARQHLAACAACRAQVDELRATLLEVRAVDAPEPSPLYWQAFRREVTRRLDAPRPQTAARWWFVPALAAGMAAAVIVLPRPWAEHGPAATQPVAATLPAWTPLPTVDEDDGLAVLQTFASGGALASVGECRDLTECAAELGERDREGLESVLGAPARGGQS